MSFSEKIKELRFESNISQKVLAEKLGLSQSCVTKLENGLREPTGSTLIAFSKFFNVSVDYLVGLEEDSPATVSIKSPAPALSEDEKELLNIFSSLSDSGKDTVMVAARNAARFENKGSIHKRA